MIYDTAGIPLALLLLFFFLHRRLGISYRNPLFPRFRAMTMHRHRLYRKYHRHRVVEVDDRWLSFSHGFMIAFLWPLFRRPSFFLSVFSSPLPLPPFTARSRLPVVDIVDDLPLIHSHLSILSSYLQKFLRTVLNALNNCRQSHTHTHTPFSRSQ